MQALGNSSLAWRMLAISMHTQSKPQSEDSLISQDQFRSDQLIASRSRRDFVCTIKRKLLSKFFSQLGRFSSQDELFWLGSIPFLDDDDDVTLIGVWHEGSVNHRDQLISKNCFSRKSTVSPPIFSYVRNRDQLMLSVGHAAFSGGVEGGQTSRNKLTCKWTLLVWRQPFLYAAAATRCVPGTLELRSIDTERLKIWLE